MTSLNGAIFPSKDLLEPEQAAVLQDFANQLNFANNPSFVYHRAKEVHTVNKEVRQSKTCIIRDPELLAFVNEVVITALEQAHPDLSIKLARDYLTFIRYDEGDFFDWHTDFEKLKVNGGRSGFKEMHFLYCVQGPEVGGELLVEKMVGGLPVVETLREACTTNRAVIFDKLLKHRAEEIKQGTKIILTVDLFVTTHLRLENSVSDELEFKLDRLVKGEVPYMIIGGDEDDLEKVYRLVQNDSQTPDQYIPFGQLQITSSDEWVVEIDWIPGKILRISLSSENSYSSHKIVDVEDPDERVIENYDGDGSPYDYFYLAGRVFAAARTLKCRRLERNWRPWERVERVPVPLERIRKTDRYGEIRESLLELAHNFKDNKKETYSLPEQAFELLEAVGASGIGEDYCIQSGFPTLSTLKFKDYQKTQPILSLPPSLMKDEEFWEKDHVGYTYHCNEPSYDEFEINYRYGLVKFEPSMLDPPYAEQFPGYGAEVFRQIVGEHPLGTKPVIDCLKKMLLSGVDDKSDEFLSEEEEESEEEESESEEDNDPFSAEKIVAVPYLVLQVKLINRMKELFEMDPSELALIANTILKPYLSSRCQMEPSQIVTALKNDLEIDDQDGSFLSVIPDLLFLIRESITQYHADKA